MVHVYKITKHVGLGTRNRRNIGKAYLLHQGNSVMSVNGWTRHPEA